MEMENRFAEEELRRSLLAKRAEDLLSLNKKKLENDYRATLIKDAQLIAENKRELDIIAAKKNNDLLEEKIRLTKARMDYYQRSAVLQKEGKKPSRTDGNSTMRRKKPPKKSKNKSSKGYLEDGDGSEVHLSENDVTVI